MARCGGEWRKVASLSQSTPHSACLRATVLRRLGTDWALRVHGSNPGGKASATASRRRSEAIRARSAGAPNTAAAISAISSSEKRSSQKRRSVLVGCRRRAGKRHKGHSLVLSSTSLGCRWSRQSYCQREVLGVTAPAFEFAPGSRDGCRLIKHSPRFECIRERILPERRHRAREVPVQTGTIAGGERSRVRLA